MSREVRAPSDRCALVGPRWLEVGLLAVAVEDREDLDRPAVADDPVRRHRVELRGLARPPRGARARRASAGRCPRARRTSRVRGAPVGSGRRFDAGMRIFATFRPDGSFGRVRIQCTSPLPRVLRIGGSPRRRPRPRRAARRRSSRAPGPDRRAGRWPAAGGRSRCG